MDECLEALETSAVASTDKLLCQLIRLQHITEEFTLQFQLEDTTAPIRIRAIQRNFARRAFEGQLTSWRENTPDDVWNGNYDSLHFIQQCIYGY